LAPGYGIMKITSKRLRRIIKEELLRVDEATSFSGSHGQADPTELDIQHQINEDARAAAGKIAVTAGTAILTSMMSSASGRERLADILVALPDFVKTHICDAADVIRQNVEDSSGVLGKSLGALQLVCRGAITVAFGPLYLVAYILRMLTDDAAKAALEKAREASPTTPEDIEIDAEIEVDTEPDTGNNGGGSPMMLPPGVDPDIEVSDELVAEVVRNLLRKD
jgi:hypothetical protein